MNSADRIQAAKRYLRRKYSDDLDGLKALADTVATSAFDSVTITGNAFEGGSATGALTFEPAEYLGAIEDVIQELDITQPDSNPGTVEAVFHTRFVQA